jgi:hypothetical protein
MNWFLIPARPENIDRSIRKPVALADLRQFLGEAESARLAALGGGEIRCWAMTDGSKSQFDKMAPGDHVLISERGTKRFNYLAEVTATITNQALGDYLWPVKPRANASAGDSKSWKFIYFLKDLRSIEANKAELLVLLGHESNDAVAGSRQLDNAKLARFERENGPLLEWLRTNAGLVAPAKPASVLVTMEREPTVEIPPKNTIGSAYVPVTTTQAYAVSDQWFPYNAEKIERGTKGHADTQNALAKFLQERGIEPRRPLATEPDFDLAWLVGETVFVAEVKSTTDDNEEHQLRLGLGQVLRYQHRIAQLGKRVVAVLVPEREPRDVDWLKLCLTLGVRIGWPGAFERVLGSA